MTFPAPLIETRQLGRWRIHALQAGGQQLDGGAMFGVVPKPLWERRLRADERNRIPMGMRCLLVEHESGLVLVDTGAGNKETDKFYSIYGIENSPESAGMPDDPGPTSLEAAIRAAGFTPDDVKVVINTHLHFDHAGGNTLLTDGEVVPAFPNARYVVSRGEIEYARNANERTTASYFPHNYEPLVASGAMELVEGEPEVVPGIRLLHTPGHTPFHHSVLVESEGERLCFLADLIPTQWHLPLPWIMGYDVEPLVTLASKRRLLAQAVAEQWTLMFEHDAHTAWGRVEHDGKSYGLAAAEGG
ncbi:MAG TPA: MBL fold metallo-hydrolase [Gemmatimonadales bacterium]|nr:MBL fold metallo-hydrolase [Gemmatimonadales bacterium]